ncbi:hypothetical protein K3495_g10089 [Podosphaera aphanis]|nr:hypothetical protein K3495_g10089 [Podosphaera aphanis]
METRRRAKANIIQLPNQDLEPIGQAPSLPKTTVVERPPKGKDIFDEINIHKLWDQAIKKDPSFKIIYSSVAKGERSLPSSVGNSIQMPDCTFDDKLALTYRGALWVPDWEPLRTALIQLVHDSHVTGHPGREVTLSILARNFFWLQQYKDVRRFVRNCHVCGRSKIWRQSSQGLLRPLPIPDRFHSEIAVDFMTELPLTDKNERFLMVIHDRLLGSATLEAMETMGAEKCAERFVISHWRYHGFPNSLTSDRGSNWVGRFWQRLCQLVGIQQRLSTAFHPQTDGGTEMNQEVLTSLRAYISYAQNDWAKLLPSAMVAINNRDSSETGFSPFFLTHGYHLDPIQRRAPRSGSTKDPKSRANAFVNRLYDGQELAKAAMETAQQIMEHNANKGRKPAEILKVGDKVWLNLKNVTTPQLKKKFSWRNAKYNITRVVAPDVYEPDVPSGIHPRFFVDLLRRDPDDPLPSQITDDSQPPPLLDGKHPLYAVDKILRAEKFNGKRLLCVKYKDYKETSWEPRENLVLTDAFRDFIQQYGEGDNVGDADTGSYTGSRGKNKNKRESGKKRTT